MRKITNELIESFKNYLIEEEKSENTIEKHIRDITFFMAWLCGQEITKILVLEYKKELCEKYAPASVNAAKNKKNERLYYLMQTICSTGIRVSELRYITTSAVKSGQAVINCKGKMRIVILPKELCKMLKRYIRENNIKNGSVFVSRNGKALDRSHIWKMLKA